MLTAEREIEWLEQELRGIVRDLHVLELDVPTKARLVQDRARLEARIDELKAEA